jgi:hypothetical protein
MKHITRRMMGMCDDFCGDALSVNDRLSLSNATRSQRIAVERARHPAVLDDSALSVARPRDL